jgi:hypothetical protein
MSKGIRIAEMKYALPPDAVSHSAIETHIHYGYLLATLILPAIMGYTEKNQLEQARV